MADDRCGCGGELRPGRRWCSSWCEARAGRGLEPQPPPPLRPVEVPRRDDPRPTAGPHLSAPASSAPRSMFASVQRALEGAGLTDSWEGATALDLAAAMDAGASGSARAALARELRAVMGEALRGVDEAGSRVGAYRDELAARRARRAGG